jgi:flavin reductase (DIM6/NTAB) family NADH-FMN oxidoreductase RutF
MAKECPVNIECTVFKAVDCGSHHLYIGKIVEIHADPSCVTDGKTDIKKVNPILYTHAAYFDVGNLVDMAFSAGKNYQKG